MKHIHLIGICGTAMASLAGMLQQRGHHVTGSDRDTYPPMSDLLEKMGIKVMKPFSRENLAPRPDLIVVGNAISRGNPEVERMLDDRVPFCSMAQLLKEDFLSGHNPVVVAGTHGKTTTTSMLAWIFECAGKHPSFFVGGIAENFGTTFKLDDGEEFIVEGDEYDTAFFDKGPKFLHYFPESMILTSVEFDHADIYKDLDAVKTAFRRLVNLVPSRGCILACLGNDRSSDNVSECVSKAFCPVERYGFAEHAYWRAVELKFESGVTSWKVLRQGQPWAVFEFGIAGEYNVLNATAAAAMAAGYGISQTYIGDALKTFKSVRRRLQVIAEIDGITIIDDFAHHPTAIAETLKALHTRYPGSRLWAICEPRSNTLRRKVFEAELSTSLAIADQIVISAVFQSDAIPPAERLSVEGVLKRIVAEGKTARQLADADAIVTAIAGELRSGDVVAILSNGGFGGIYEKLPERLRRFARAARNREAISADEQRGA